MSGGSVRIPTGERNRDRDKEEGQSKLGVVADKCAACGNAFQTKVIGGLEVFFDAYGRLVARWVKLASITSSAYSTKDAALHFSSFSFLFADDPSSPSLSAWWLRCSASPA